MRGLRLIRSRHSHELPGRLRALVRSEARLRVLTPHLAGVTRSIAALYQGSVCR